MQFVRKESGLYCLHPVDRDYTLTRVPLGGGLADKLLERSNFGLGGCTSDLEAEAEGWLPSFSLSLSRRSNSNRPFDGRASWPTSRDRGRRTTPLSLR